MKNIKKTAGKLFAMILTVSVAVSCVVSTGIFTASAYTAQKEGKIFYNKTMYDKYGKAEGMVLDSLKNFDEEIDISSLNVPRSDVAEFFKVLTLTHPELYYVNQGFSYSYYPSEDKVASIYFRISKSPQINPNIIACCIFRFDIIYFLYITIIINIVLCIV